MSTGGGELAEAKARVRGEMRARLGRLAPERRRAAGEAVARRLADAAAVRRARTVMVFLSLPTEIDTWPVIRRLWQEGKRVAVPRLEPGAGPLRGRRMAAVVLEPADVARAADHPALRPGEFGILEAPGAPEVPPGEIDVVLAPCLAVDRAGRRLGRGGGFYDRFLAQPDLKAARLVIAMREQVLEEVPAGPQDQRVAVVVTDAEMMVEENDE